MFRSTRRWSGLVLVALALVLGPARAADPPPDPPRLKPDAELPADRHVDVDLGQARYSESEDERYARKVAEFYSRELGLVNNPDEQHRLDQIGHRVITAAAEIGPKQIATDRDQTPPLQFTFHLVKSDDINAFSTWGGQIFVTQGIVDFCQSDDELAGIVAHEVAHNMFHHLHDQIQRLQRYQQQQLLALLGAAFMGINVAKAAVMTQYVQLALMNGHSVEAETQADYAGCFYSYVAGYNPVGMITVFERLHRLYRLRPTPADLGAFQTHPWSDERAAHLEAQIKVLGLPVNRRAVTKALTAGVRVTPQAEGPAKVEVLLGDSPLMTMQAKGTAPTPEDRASDAALTINKALNHGLESGQLRLEKADDDSYAIRAYSQGTDYQLLDVQPDDAKGADEQLPALALTVYRRLKASLRQDEMSNGRL